MAMAVIVYLIIVLFLWGLNSRITFSGLEGNCTQGTLYIVRFARIYKSDILYHTPRDMFPSFPLHYRTGNMVK